jgi:hypothetical protein
MTRFAEMLTGSVLVLALTWGEHARTLPWPVRPA